MGCNHIAKVAGPIKIKSLRELLKLQNGWIVYLTMTILCGLGYYFVGMTIFDSIATALTIAIGGFSTHDASFDFMIISGLS